MIHNLLDICNEGCDLKRFMGEPVCKKCEAEPSIMSLIVPPEGIARNPKTRPTGKTWSEEKIVWKADTRGVQKNPRRFGFTERDVATKKFYKLKGSQPGSVTFRLGEDMNPYIIHDNYKNLSAEEREKWIKVKPLHEILKKDEWRLGERGKEYAREYRKNVQQVLATKKKREAKAKEEGLEEALIGIMASKDIENFFFLDQSFPFLIKTANSGEKRCAVRISEFESIDTVMSLAGKVNWVWVDCFTKFPLSQVDSVRLQQEGKFKLCLVSPELQGRKDKNEVKEFRNKIYSQGIKGEAVCTKYPDLWA